MKDDSENIDNFNENIFVEINKYRRLCPQCYYFDKKTKTCDMCSVGYPLAKDNNGLKPSEVQSCDVYFKKGDKDER